MKNWVLGLLVVLVSCSKEKVEISYDQQLALDVKIIDDYLAKKGATNVVEHPSGLRYIVHTLGTGPIAQLDSRLLMDYTGLFLPSEATFTQAPSPLQYFTNPLSELIEGFRIAFQELPQGTEVSLYIPSGLCYGTQGRPGVPANANMIFEVKFIDILGSSIVDADGNSYGKLTISGRFWSSEDLVSGTFLDGTAINLAESTYNGDDIRMYSFDIATDTRGICPAGYHVPTLEEWQSVLGVASNDNLLNMSARGYYDVGGNLQELNVKGVFWSSSEVSSTEASAIAYIAETGVLVPTILHKDSQASIRCVREF